MAIPHSHGRTPRHAGAVSPSRVPVIRQDVSAETPTEENQTSREVKEGECNADSWWSHAAFGFGTLALIGPFFIPGIPRRDLLITYFAGGVVVMMVPMLWGVIRETRTWWRLRKRPRNDGFWLR